MSKARSPRDVCSTTMGTRGLMVLALFLVVALDLLPAESSNGSAPSASNRRSGGSGALTSPQVGPAPGLARALRRSARPASRASSRSAACSTGSALACSASRSIGRALGEVLLAARRAGPAFSSRVAQLLGRACCSRAAVACERVEDVAVGRLDPLGLDDRGEDGLAAQRLLGVGLGLLEDLVLVAAGDLQVDLLGDPLVARASAACGPTARARGPRRAPRAPRPSRCSTTASSTASRNSASTCARRPRAACAAMSSRSSSSVSKPAASAAKSSSSVGQVLALDLLDGDRELGVLARELLGAVVVGEGDLRRCAPRRPWRPRAAPRSRGSGARSRAR